MSQHQPWLQPNQYFANLKWNTTLNSNQTLTSMISQQIANLGPYPAFANFGTHITYQQFGEYSHQLAQIMQHNLNINNGDRVAIMMPNLCQYPIIIYACLLIGATIVNLNPLYTTPEVEEVLNDSATKLIFALETAGQTLANANLKHKPTIIITKVGDLLTPKIKAFLINFTIRHLKRAVPKYTIPNSLTWEELFNNQPLQPLQPTTITPETLAFLQYTGGTTGTPKGAILTHGNIMANLNQIGLWIRQCQLPITNPIENHSPEDKTTNSQPLKQLHPSKDQAKILSPLPFYHIFSLTTNCFLGIYEGWFNILITNPRDTKKLITTMQQYDVNIMTGVNTLFHSMLNHPELLQEATKSNKLKVIIAGGMAVHHQTATQWHKITKTVITEGYGLTEASPVICANHYSNTIYTGSIGMPLPQTKIKVVDENNQEVELGQPGELYVSGPQVMQGYWNKQQETQNTLHGKWLATGDIVKIDPATGLVYVLDRKKDLIIVSGFNVYPNEVEDCLTQHHTINEVGVIGIPDPNTGEAVKAIIVLNNEYQNTPPNLSEIRKFASQHLAHYKIPTHLDFISELPKTNIGKILRRKLRNK